MDALTLAGILISFLAITLGQFFEGGSLQALMNLSALMIVLGGTIGAVMVQTPLNTFKRAFKILPWVITPPKLEFELCRNKMFDLARKARQLGLLSLEEHLEVEKNPLINKGLELLVIGVDKFTIRKVLEDEIERVETHDIHAAQVFESMGGYSPTIGILGAVLGLIQVMRHLSEPNELGLGIAVAFVATIYGVGMANLIFLPVANKLKSCIARQVHYDEMIVEGIVTIASGESPGVLMLKLNNFGQQKKNEKKKKKK
ncbi:flagellar motor protein [Legionella anisa]|uniref:Flagellar motor protein n=1 Tax=Legionella anisa TaxID=28082 RepID=A0AAX0WUG9_9GAMM|nr:flagellar motor protein [Legionella anisa]AWN74017.1 flagellar motor protein [Legionella anisa]KTC67290.1 flagellar motor protein [Legionella anisa]MBN5934040.1 flagellar motor protein [Legionella anisa]MCW8425963.1 flagellar motor protein [Legionella anisa]MCW8448603.1 flagellar motor protein [Legionella anisa]